jgi:hypothetical protein
MRFVVYRKGRGDELWQRWVSTGKERLVGRPIPGQVYMLDVSSDGKDILWVKRGYRSKLVLVKNVFE